MLIVVLLGIVGILLALILWDMYKKLRYWKNKNIPDTVKLSDYKYLFQTITNRLRMADLMLDMYNASEKSVFGAYVFNLPTLMVKDPEMLRTIMIKDFEHFTDHMDLWADDSDPLFAKNLFALKGERWHAMRTTLSPAFSGSKMRFMFELIRECGDQLVHHFQKQFDQIEGDEKLLKVELQNVCVRLTSDLITSIALGFKIDSLEYTDNKFYKIGKYFENLKLWRILFVTRLPRIAKFFNVKVIPDWITNFFRETIRHSIELRERENIIRPDMLHILTEARKGLLEHETNPEKDEEFAIIDEMDVAKPSKEKLVLTEEDLLAQVFIFLTAGYINVALLMCWTSYELAVNPDVQDKLYIEIKQTLEKNNGKLTYDILRKMKYLDLVVTETLRKWPPLPFTHRQCTKPYKLKTEYGEIDIELGTILFISIYGLHRDPNYYPNPERFDPERFADSNTIRPFTYLPFGNGPRICIAARLALMEVKIFLVYLLSNFEFTVTDKTLIPPRLKSGMSIEPEDGFWLGIKPRKSQ